MRPIRLAMVMAATLGLSGVSSAQAAAPPEVVRSAITAVEQLGEQVVLGNHRAAIDSMYPQWKERMAKRKGGMEKLERELASIGQTMARNGVDIVSFKAVGQPKLYEVFPDGADNETEATMSYRKWLLLIPTVTQIRILPPNERKARIINSHGFQVAISEKGENRWTFINGSDVSVSDLRSLFLTLPPNMGLPEVKRELAE